MPSKFGFRLDTDDAEEAERWQRQKDEKEEGLRKIAEQATLTIQAVLVDYFKTVHHPCRKVVPFGLINEGLYFLWSCRDGRVRILFTINPGWDDKTELEFQVFMRGPALSQFEELKKILGQQLSQVISQRNTYRVRVWGQVTKSERKKRTQHLIAQEAS